MADEMVLATQKLVFNPQTKSEDSLYRIRFEKKTGLEHFFVFNEEPEDFIKEQYNRFSRQIIMGSTPGKAIQNTLNIQMDPSFFDDSTDLSRIYVEVKYFFSKIHNETVSLFEVQNQEKSLLDFFFKSKDGEYPFSLSSEISNTLALQGISLFYKELNPTFDLAEVVKYFFENRLEEYNINEIKVFLPDSSATFLEKCKSFGSEIEHILKQWNSVMWYKEVKADLIAFSSTPLSDFSNVEDLEGNSIFTPNEIDYFNYNLNQKGNYSDALDLRNKYSHGAYIENENMHRYNYYRFFKVIFLMMISIERYLESIQEE